MIAAQASVTGQVRSLMPDTRRLLRAFAVSLLMVGLAATAVLPAWGQAPSASPMLRVEAGMHVNLVRAVAVDAAGRWAVTASDDKTARTWDIVAGMAGPVLRVPIAEGAQAAEGRLQAVAVTADGGWVAVAGRSGGTWAGSNAIYVFERASGRLVRRIDTGSPLPVVALALSPDNRLLAAGLGDNGGLRVFDFASGAMVHSDTRYSGSIYALDFRRDSRVLVAGAADGALRIYLVDERQLRFAGTGKPENGKLISQLRFSPDGELLAVGLEDSPQVLVLDSRTLDVVGSPAVPADGNANFSSLAWSPDGRELWGGGTHRQGNQWLLRVWPRDDWAQFADRPVASASVLALAMLPGQRVLWVSGEPAWGVVDAAAQVQRRASSPLVNFNSLARQFRVAADGSQVAFWYGHRQPLHRFDLGARAILEGEGTGDAPRVDAPGLVVESWENRRGATLNGRRLALDEFETSRCLAIARDGRRFALGTDERLHLFNADGNPVWSRRMTSLVWAVNLSADGRFVVAALQDGTIRWHRASDGQELLALLPHADRKRWVLFTPGGYFDAAAGAEELLGWHFNRGAAAAADFHPMWTLRARFGRADVVDRVLPLGDEAQAVQQANAAAGKPSEPALSSLTEALPPMLEIVGTPVVQGVEGTAMLRVRVRTLAQSPLTTLRARADGRPASVETLGTPTRSNSVPGSEERNIRVRFAGQPEQLALLAENRHGISAAATLQVRWAAAGQQVPAAAAVQPAPPASGFVNVPPAADASAIASPPPLSVQPGTEDRRPRLYVLAIGIGKFAEPQIGVLNYSAKDARDFSNSLKAQQGRLYRSVEVRLLVDEQATRAGVVAGIDWLKSQVTQHDVGMLFVASHGVNDPKHGYLFITHNFDVRDPLGTGISNKEFKDATESLAGKVLFFIDTCHSGNVLGGARTRSAAFADPNAVINELVSADSGVVVFSASTGRQSSLESPDWGNGAFTKSVVEGLSGRADVRRTGRVTHKMLDYYVTERVKELTSGKQSAVTISPNGVPDFPLALVR